MFRAIRNESEILHRIAVIFSATTLDARPHFAGCRPLSPQFSVGNFGKLGQVTKQAGFERAIAVNGN
jgi:hypothetical protein